MAFAHILTPLINQQVNQQANQCYHHYNTTKIKKLNIQISQKKQKKKSKLTLIDQIGREQQQQDKQMFFVIQDDKPIYQLYFGQGDRQVKELFLVHSALDAVEYALTKKKDYYLGQLKNDQLNIFAFVNPNQLRLLLVLNLQSKKEIDKKTDSQIREFFFKANQYLASATLNPLYKPKEPIKSKLFDDRIRNLARDSLKTLLLEKKK